MHAKRSRSLTHDLLFSAIVCAGALLAHAQRGAAAEEGATGMRTITDMARREVRLPQVVRSVYSTSPIGDIMMYTLAPDKAAGISVNLTSDERRYLADEYNRKPVLGGWFGKNTTGNPEVILKVHPDAVLSMSYLDKTAVSSAERIQNQLGIPVIMVDSTLTNLDASYHFMGGIIGEPERADRLAAYCRKILKEVQAIATTIPTGEQVRVYYAEGLGGLETDPKGSQHTEVLDMVGGLNVADVPLVRGYGRAGVSLEQLLVWQPAVIIVCSDRNYADGTGNWSRIVSDPAWQDIAAVKNGKVYAIPSLPHNWFDRPPSVNRILGLLWLGNLLYPDRFKLDIRAKTREFYGLFYHKDLTNTELEEVLTNAVAH
jgi:iron complex transport system substrate-binding protein